MWPGVKKLLPKQFLNFKLFSSFSVLNYSPAYFPISHFNVFCWTNWENTVFPDIYYDLFFREGGLVKILIKSLLRIFFTLEVKYI